MSTRLYSFAGIFASIVLIAFGAGAIYMGLDGRAQVRDDLAREQIVGTDDSTIPGQKVDTGSEAQAFAAVMGIALLLTGIGFLVLTARVLWPAGVREQRRTRPVASTA
jgi:hypothetical protein